MTKKIKILAIDDEEFNLDIMVSILEEEGYEVIQATDGDSALQELAAHPDIALILADRMMPRMTGVELVQKLKTMPEGKDIPVIMQSAAASLEQTEQGKKAGVYFYLTKPFDAEALIAIVRKALTRG